VYSAVYSTVTISTYRVACCIAFDLQKQPVGASSQGRASIAEGAVCCAMERADRRRDWRALRALVLVVPGIAHSPVYSPTEALA
jgi:hypothetical protein